MGGTTRPQHVLPVFVCISGVALFSIMDGMMKQLGFMVGVYNALLWRSLVGTVLGGAFMLVTRPPRPSRRTLRLHILRGIIVAGMTFFFFWALDRLPLAEAVALSFVAPLIALYLAALILHERVEREAILASVLGLAGVAVILAGRMGKNYEADALWGAGAVIVSAILYAINLIIQKRQASLSDPVEIAFFQHLLVAAIFLIFAPGHAIIPQTEAYPLILLSALFAFVSLALIAWAYARAEASRLIPIEYSAFIWSAVTGWLMFREGLSLWTIAGAVLIVAGCLITARTKAPAHVESSIA